MLTNALGLIQKKRAGEELTYEELSGLVEGVLEGQIPDYQLSALLMAICYERLSHQEAYNLTRVFVESGKTIEWPPDVGTVVDKHSTGGVGDKVTLALAPWMAACGLKMPKMSGRGLGHTGGTIDKLESIPGFDVNLTPERLNSLLKSVGCAVAAQTEDLVKADKKFYEMRDVTGTVDELGLIAASVMSKKLAAGAPVIVLDVKCGNGAFFTDLSKAEEFADLSISIGRQAGRRVACLISNMDQPLGIAAGNALEVAEVRGMFRGGREPADLYTLCVELGAVLLDQAGECDGLDEGRGRMAEAYQSGAAGARFTEWITAQGGDLLAFDQRLNNMQDYRRIEVRACQEGWIKAIDTLAIGEFVRSLGAGRRTKTDVIDPLVGIECYVKTGGQVSPDMVVAVVTAAPSEQRDDAELAGQLRDCYMISVEAVDVPRVVLKLVT